MIVVAYTGIPAFTVLTALLGLFVYTRKVEGQLAIPLNKYDVVIRRLWSGAGHPRSLAAARFYNIQEHNTPFYLA
jgi:hypothetical protein